MYKRQGWKCEENTTTIRGGSFAGDRRDPAYRLYAVERDRRAGRNTAFGISFYDPDKTIDFIADIFQKQNNAKLGDTGQDMIVYNDYIYAVSYTHLDVYKRQSQIHLWHISV